MRVITVSFSAAADGRAVSFDRDSVIVGILAQASSVVVSCNPADSIAKNLTAPGDAQLNNIILTKTGNPLFVPMAFPVSVGESVFVSAGGLGNVQLFMQDAG